MDILNLFHQSEASQRYQAGETLMREGEPGDVMYVIVEGEAVVSCGGRELERVGKGGIIGEMAMIESKPRSATATALTECLAVPVDRKHFTFLVQETPHFALHLMSVMADRLRRMNTQG